MTLRQIRIGSSANVLQYDDDDFGSAMETDQPIKAGKPVDPSDVLRLSDLGGYLLSTSDILDDGTVVLPAITANSAAHGFIHVSAAGVIEQSAEFEIDSTGTAQIIRGTAAVIVNADTDTKLCIGTAAAQNPMTIKNRLGGTKRVMITLWYN